MSAEIDEFTKSDQEVMSEAVNYVTWLLTAIVNPHLGPRVLEIGSGIGNYSVGIASSPLVQALTCIELDELCVAQCRQAVASLSNSKRITCIHGDFADIELPRETFDAVVCLNVLEHLADDVAAARKTYAALAPGGKFILFVPAFPLLMGTIDHRLGHHRRYTRASATRMLRSCGFQVEQARYYNLSGFFGWFWRFRVQRRAYQDRRVVRTFDRVVFPMQARLERLAPWLPVGQSLFVLAVKPSAAPTLRTSALESALQPDSTRPSVVRSCDAPGSR